ncbi:DUF4781 domain-containing protein [Halomonas huangheensis]|uniref:LysM domain-containing protein n=1 Tax=Halomonas huangheensis TaxID=1178482 RepID=W1N9S1_9GAMM|nr:DUF4781 domain-containing protein [Halomonas huangheensis]ALM53811.1 hypothetical protein AR456_17190 [Halomonas huangheensis]ERL52254.1 hypothetical protein BJB45_09820 [Halomonas huangheensis]
MINLIRNVRQLLQPDAADIFSSVSAFSRVQATPFSTPAPLQVAPTFFLPPPPPPPPLESTPVFQPQAPLEGQGLGVYSPQYLNQASYPFLDADTADTPLVIPVDNGVADEGLSAEEAESIASDIAGGKTIDQVAAEYEVSRQDVIDQLETDGLEIETSSTDEGHQNTTITDSETDDTIAEYSITEQQDGVEVEEFTNADGETTTTVTDEDGQRTELDADQQTTREGIDDIVNGIADGQSIDEIAEAQGLSPEQVIAQIEAAGYEYSSEVEGQGPSYTPTTRITAEDSGDLVVSHEVNPSGSTTSVVNDTDGNETHRVENPDGSSTETVTEPDGRKTITSEDADGKITTTVTYEQNGVTVEEVTGNDGETTTIIIDDDGTRTELDDGQGTAREDIDDIVAAVANGKSIEAIAEQNGLTRAQVEAQLRAAGYVVESSSGQQTNGLERYTTEIVSVDDPDEVIASHSSAAGMTPETSLSIDSNGTEIRTTDYNDGRSHETVTRKDGRETSTSVDAEGNTTTSVTDNGYTLTTHPDGNLTLQRNEDGTEIKIEEGTPEAALADTLMEINPDSSDQEEARAAEVVQEVIEGMMAGERIEDLQSSIDDKTEELNQAIEDYQKEYGDDSIGVAPENNVTLEDPYGDPPAEDPPSGGSWVPMNGVWMDSAVARATLELNELVSEQLEAGSEFRASQAQLDVYALDSNYEGALDRAQQIIDEALAPHGLVWVRPEKPSGSLADAQQRLDDAEAMVEQARGASTEYADAQDLLDDAIYASNNVPEATSMGICTAEDTSDDLKLMQDQYEREQSERDAALTNVDSLFYDMGLHNARGNNLMADYSVGFHEQQLAAAEPGSKQHSELTDALEEARSQQQGSSSQLDVAQAYSEYHHTRSDQAQLQSDSYDIRDDLLEAFNEDKGLNEEGKEFSRVSGDYLGEFTGEQIIEEREDGLWVTTHFEHGTTEEQLAPEEMSEFWEKNRDPEVTANWLEHLDNRQGAHQEVSNANAALAEAVADDLGIRQQALGGEISDLEAELENMLEEEDDVTTAPPEGLFADGEEPQNIGDKEQPLLVTQEMADTVAEDGLLAALSSSDQPVGIKIDGETLWVPSDIAVTSIALSTANANHQALGDARQGLTEASDRLSLVAEQPAQRMGESDMDHQARLDLGMLEDNSEQALNDIYQPMFQQLAAQGYDNKFTTYKNDELEPMLDERFGLNRNTDERSEALDEVLESIHDIGGDDPQINIVPMFHVGAENGISQVNLIAVQGDDGEVRYVDLSGKHYDDLEDFQNNNELFRGDGKLVAPRDLEMSSTDGNVALEVADAYNTSNWDTVVDPLVGIGTGIATVLSFTPAAPIAAPLAYAGGTYLGVRALQHQINHVSHGGDWNDLESGLNYLSIATTIFPAVSSSLRTVGMSGRTFNAANSSVQVTRGQAFLASIGGVKPGSNVAEATTTFMRSGETLNRVARGFDWAAIATGMPLMYHSAKSLIQDGSQMSGLQLTDAIVGLTTGFAGTGLGAHGLWTTRPGRNTGGETTGSNTLQLHDDSGNVIDARILGNPPESAEHVYLQPEIGPRPRGDEASVADKTHILQRDPQTGETYITAWIRGPSEAPGTPPVHTQTRTPPEGMAQLYRLDDLEALNQASQEGTLTPGLFVHIVRSPGPGLENGQQVITGGTVPRSGRVSDEGHIIWPSTGPGESVRLSLEQGRNQQQQLHISNASGESTPRSLNIGENTHFIVLSDQRVSDFRAQVQDGGGLPFALYSGNGQWTLAAGQSPDSVTPQNSGENTPSATETQPTNEAIPAASQATPDPDLSVTNGEITLHQDGDIVHLSGLDTNLSSVIGQSNRRRGSSLYDRNADAGARPDTVTLPRDVLELALSPEAAARLPDGESIEVALVTNPEVPTQSSAPVAADSSPSARRRNMARLLAALGVGGSLYGVGSAHAWTGDVLNRAASPESPAMLFNGSGFIARGVLNALKAGFDGKLKANGESLANGELSAQLLNWEASRILASRRALNLNNEQVGQISGLIEGLWGRHQLLDSLPVTQASEQRGWTAEAKNTAIKQQVDDYYRQLASITGKTVEEVKGISPLDSQNPKGIAFNSSILATHLVNDIVSWQYLQHQAHNGELFSLAPLDLVGNLGLAGFLAANVALAGSAAVKVGTGLVRVNLNSLRLTEKLTTTSTFLGSYLYGIMTPPWAALTLHSAATAFSEGNWLTGSINMAAVPFQVGLSYYGIKGLRDDAISMMQTWKNGADLAERSWPMRSAFAATTIPMAALTGTAAGMQLAEGNLFAASVLGGGTALQAYFISLAARLNWHDPKTRHNPLLMPMSEQARQVDAQRLWQGVGWTLAAGMFLPGLLDLKAWWQNTDDKDENEDVSSMGGSVEDAGSDQDATTPQPVASLDYIAGHGHRINPNLENHQGYYSVEVQNGQSLGSIILNHGHRNVAEVVAMNMEHIADPTSLHAGDRIYLPRETA